MGGCSSKPKTIEGVMEMQEEEPQGDATSKGAEAERIAVDSGLKYIEKEQETSEWGIENAIVEKEYNHSCNMLAETEKNICAGFNAEGESKVERPVLEDDGMYVKQLVDKEINGDLSFERHTTLKEEIKKGLKILAPAGSHLHEDSILIKVSTPELKEMPVVSVVNAGTQGSLEEPFTSSKRSFEMEVQPVMSEYKPSATQKDISYDRGESHLQQAESNTLTKDVCIEAEKMMVLQESIALENIDLEMPDYSCEEARKRAVTLESQEVVHLNQGQMLDSSPRQKKQVGTVEMESQDTSKEAGKEVWESASQKAVHENHGERLVDNPKYEESNGCDVRVNGACILDDHSEQRGEEVLGGRRLLLGKDKKAEDAAIDVANFDMCPNNYQSLLVEHVHVSVHEAYMQVKVEDDTASRFAFAERFANSHAEPMPKDLRPVNNDLQKESTGEATSDDSWYILEKVDVRNDNFSTLFSKENNYQGLPKNGDNVPRETSRNAVICDDKVMVSSEEKPGVQPSPVLDSVGLAFKNILAQELSAPDIDDVLEKLASEFERQESLAHSDS